MTKEQIIQNAEEYAKQFLEPYDKEYAPIKYVTAQMAHIAGAHSRDEEIEELKNRLAEMTRLKNSYAGGIDILDRDNKELQEQVNKLRNPWISVKDRLPEKGKKWPDCPQYSIDVFIRGKKGSPTVAYYNFDAREWYLRYPVYWHIKDDLDLKRGVTHWMSIPELPEGGNE